MSTAKIALVLFEIFFLLLQRLYKIFLCISANTGMQFQCNILATVADIVQGVTIISSPGSISKDPTMQINPEVHEFTVIACLTL